MSADAFSRTSENEAGAWVRYTQATCSKCGRPGKVRDTTRHGMAFEMAAANLRRQGWDVSPSRDKHTCAKCRMKRPDLTPQQRRAAFCKIAGVPRAKPKTSAIPPKESEAMPAVATVVPIDPRQPTTEQRRSIRDALDAAYLEDQGRYSGDGSDRALAASLDLPAKWVTDLREAMGLGPDRNEVELRAAAEMDRLEAKAKDIESRALALAEEAEGLGREVTKLKASR